MDQQHHEQQLATTTVQQPADACSSLATHDCLPLLLQHTSFQQDAQLLISLLSVCQSMRATIAQQCGAQLCLECRSESLETVASFAAFLRRFAALAAMLDVSWNRLSLPEVEQQLRDALQAAAGGGDAVTTPAAAVTAGRLRVRAVKANVIGPLLLGALPCDTLTSLEVGHCNDYAGAHETAAAALARLTGLQDLTVLSSSSHLLLPAASALTALTRACFLIRELPDNAHKLKHLPAQLLKLELTVGWGAGGGVGLSGSSSSRPALPLRHLTALQELRGSGYFALQAHDELPGALVSLQVPDCPVAQPLLQLTNLSTLNIYNSTTRAEQLRLIASALPQLSECTLGYFGAEESPDVNAAAPGWPGLPGLRALDFDSNSGEFRLGPPALDALGRLGSCLTQLALSGGVVVDATPTELSQVLARLTKLQTLRLASVELLHEPPLTVTTSTRQQQQQGAAGDEAEAPSTAATAADGSGGAVHSPGAMGAAQAAAAAVGGSSSRGGVATAPEAAAGGSSRMSTRSSGCRVEWVSPSIRVTAAVARLPSLRCLKLGGLGSWFIHPVAELQPLAEATQLTCLHLMDMGLDDDALCSILRGLSALRELDVSDNAAVGDATLGCIGAAAPLLRNLDVSGAGSVSEEGIKKLKAALPGLDVVCFQSSDEEEWL